MAPLVLKTLWRPCKSAGHLKCFVEVISNYENSKTCVYLQVYGETSFELICQILDKLHPISPENKFVDLGSGVGQVVLQVAALTDCEMSFGIEKANTPANYALVIYSAPLIFLSQRSILDKNFSETIAT